MFSRRVLIVALAVFSATTYADLGDQLAKLLPDDGAAGDGFGNSLAISGATAVVGAPSDDDNGFGSGSAYLFDISDRANPTQLFKLLPNDGAVLDHFGGSVAISGAIVIVGAFHDDDNGYNSGSAYLFDSTTGQQIAKLLPNDGAELDFFGLSVAIGGTTAIVGAYFHDDNGTNSGSAYLFDTATGEQIAKLLPDDGAADDYFGTSVAISGANGVAVVGADGDDDNGFASGSAYLFDISDPANPTQIAKLLPDDGAELDYFGVSVAIGGATAIVGARGDDDNGSLSGSAYLFDISDPANPTQIAKLLPDDGAANDRFGFRLAIGGPPGNEVPIVGADWDDDNGSLSGSAYLFDISDRANPTQLFKLLPNDGAVDDHFGVSVAISGATAIVGAGGDDDNGTDSGSAYLFDAAGTSACPWDCGDDDGEVGIVDFLALLAQWGTVDATCDFGLGAPSVGIEEFLKLLGNWGPCPK